MDRKILKSGIKNASKVVIPGLIGVGLGITGMGALTSPSEPITVMNPVLVEQLAQANLTIGVWEDANAALKAELELEKLALATAGDEYVALEADKELDEKAISALNGVFDYFVEVPEEVGLLTDDLDDDEGDLIPARVAMLKAAKLMGYEYVVEEFSDEVDKSVVGEVTIDEDDVERVKVDKDLKDMEVLDADFDDGDFKIVYRVEFEQDDVDYESYVTIKIRDNEIDDFDISSVELD